jgi:hypothetical protein
MLRDDLVRLQPFEGLCLTASDLLVEQAYHRRSLRRHARYLAGHGVVQGLSVELERRLDRYAATVGAGFGLTRDGQGVHLASDLTVPIEAQEVEGDFTLWLVHVDREDDGATRPVFDTADLRPARVVEAVEPRLVRADEELADGVAVARLRLRLGRVALLHAPVPRAGRVDRAAESWLKPRVQRFVALQRTSMLLLFRTALLQELSIAAYGFYAALVASELVLLDEGTPDRLLYRTAGTLVGHARTFYDSDAVRALTHRVGEVVELLRGLDDGTPGADGDDRAWQAWFEDFERLLPALERSTAELQATVDARAERT